MQTHTHTVNAAAENTEAEWQTAETSLVYKNQVLLWGLFVLSLISFLTTLNLPYLGEEAVYTITSLEMWHQQEWFVPTLYGNEYGRPPLYNWVIIFLANILGWPQMLLAARLVTMAATLCTTLILFFFTQRLFRNKIITLLTMCIYLSGDLLLRRGWLAYADPIFSFFVLLSIVSLWLCVEDRQRSWLWLAVLGLFGSYLSKAFTGYVFYGITLLVILWRHPNRNILYSPLSLILQGFSVLLVLFWDSIFSQGTHNQGMLQDIFSKLTGEGFLAYFVKLLSFPLEILYRWLPVTAVLLYFGIKNNQLKSVFNINQATANENIKLFDDETKSEDIKLSDNETKSENIKLIFWVFLLNCLPYWLAPFSRVRYLLPLYPFIALLFAYAVYRLGAQKIRVTIIALYAGVVLKYGLGIWGYPYYEKYYRGNYQACAKDILNTVGDFPVYSDNMTATGLSVTAHLNILRLPKSPLVQSPVPNQWQDGFIISQTPSLIKVGNTKLFKQYAFGGSKLYLLCRGAACNNVSSSPNF